LVGGTYGVVGVGEGFGSQAESKIKNTIMKNK